MADDAKIEDTKLSDHVYSKHAFQTIVSYEIRKVPTAIKLVCSCEFIFFKKGNPQYLLNNPFLT